MIVRTKPSLWDLVFTMRGSVLPHIAYPLLSLTALAALFVAVERAWQPLPVVDSAPFTVLGIALSLFLGFRNNAAYDRWWEARRLRGGHLADLRSLARESEVFMRNETLRLELLEGALVFLPVHRASLRGQVLGPDLQARAGAVLAAGHPSDAALDRWGPLWRRRTETVFSTASGPEP
ncbi:bestrophin family ion channel [Paracoccus chinensis]|uniref:Bestrophin, RFP-TM, chloride channel n=1 Tax=Paracoccus chinensis TaxID=525640 RepID=A0A1G9MN94_9RHOB|nr:bestrophin family ion channel [Paracoccus chinensis]SDL75125.1 Bestrophin, RFP-TM, chloride channel [Paracoccus chinensis]